MITVLAKILLTAFQYNEAKTPNRVDLNTVQRILEWCDEGMSLDELECITANLIFKGYIRGYVSTLPERTLMVMCTVISHTRREPSFWPRTGRSLSLQ